MSKRAVQGMAAASDLTPPMPNAGFDPSAILRGYFHAKDENRPHLLKNVFCADAELNVNNGAASIAFPAVTRGREAIADVLVRRFNQTYENIYSFYMARPPDEATRFSCGWLVGMTEKDGGNVRVGCGGYDWTFEAQAPRLASQLTITIDTMHMLRPGQFAAVFEWLEQLDYPWSSPAQARARAPALDLIAPVLHYLGSLGSRAAPIQPRIG